MFEFIKKFFSLPSKSTHNRRQHERIVDSFTVKFQKQGAEKWHDGTGRDISETGARIASYEKLKQGDEITLIIFFPRAFKMAEKLTVPSKVIRVNRPRGSKRPRHGLEFNYTHPEEDKEIVNAFTGWLLEHPYETPYRAKTSKN